MGRAKKLRATPRETTMVILKGNNAVGNKAGNVEGAAKLGATTLGKICRGNAGHCQVVPKLDAKMFKA